MRGRTYALTVLGMGIQEWPQPGADRRPDDRTPAAADTGGV